MKDRASRTSQSAKSIFKYLIGEAAPSGPAIGEVTTTSTTGEHKIEQERGMWGGVAGLFGSLKGAGRSGAQEGRPDPAYGSSWQEGEVHADLIRVSPSIYDPHTLM